MNFLDKCVDLGERILHSGQKSNVFYDVNALITDEFYFNYILKSILRSTHYVGIATRGAIIARSLARENNSYFSMIKDGELKGEIPKGDFILVDDVATTGASIREAEEIMGFGAPSIWVVVDRRNVRAKNLVKSVFDIDL
jgi:orotate phosphoribosyltransferase